MTAPGTTTDDRRPSHKNDGLHRVTWEDDHPTFHCDAPADADCRRWPSCGCEEWSDDHEHPPVQQDECWMMPWLNENEVGASFDDGDGFDSYVPKFDGPIATSWEGDWLSWVYAPDLVLVPRSVAAELVSLRGQLEAATDYALTLAESTGWDGSPALVDRMYAGLFLTALGVAR